MEQDKLTSIIAHEIKKQYKSTRQFAIAADIPYTTLSSALKNGIGSSSYDTVIKICRMLGIKNTEFGEIVLCSEKTLSLIRRYNKLDKFGRHTVESVIRLEEARLREV